MRRAAVLFAIAWGTRALLLHAQPAGVAVEGVSDKQVAADQVEFRVLAEPGYTVAADLNGEPVPLGEWATVEDPDYYELRLLSEDAAGTRRSGAIRFIVRASERGDSEWGLPPWTPPPVIPSAPEAWDGARPQWLAPSRWPAGAPIPAALWMRDAEGAVVRANGVLRFEGIRPLILRRGVGGALLPPQEAGTQVLSARLGETEIRLETAVEEVAQWTPGRIEGAETVWPAGSRIRVESDLTVPAGAALRIGPGAVVALAPEATLEVAGELTAEGEPREPVAFVPADPARPWGGIVANASTAHLALRCAILTGGGGDPSWFDRHSDMGHSHRREQPVLYLGRGAQATLQDCALLDNPGQAFHGENAFLTLDRVLVQRAIAGGQFNGGSVTVTDSALIEFPVDSPEFADEDNDAIYFTEGRHTIRRSLIGWAKDDAVDAGSGGSGEVTVEDCWIEACYHEGLAWSGGGRKTITRRTVVLNCGQGVEAGWSSSAGSPDVYAEDCFVAGCAVGLRFGDNYDWSYNGFLRVTNSVSIFNLRDVWGMNWDDWTYRTNQMDIRGNRLTAPNPLHPDNTVWDPEAAPALLARWFRAPDAPPGAGLGEAARQVSATAFRRGVRLALSEPAGHPVRIHYEWRLAGGNTLAGEQEIPPGAPWARVPIPAEASSRAAWLRLTDAEGGVLTGQTDLLLLPPNAAAREIVPAGSLWRYLDGNRRPGADWTAPEYDDSEWQEGRAQLGFGDGDEVTAVDGGPSGNRYPTVYFRRTFEMPESSAWAGAELAVLCDDGAIVYLNGQEVFRYNLPEGPVAHDTYTGHATSSESAFHLVNLPAGLLRPGENTLAAEVHQANKTSSDMSFDLRLSARPAPRLGWIRAPDAVALYWTAPEAILEETPSPLGPWMQRDEAESPVLIQPQGARFFRLRLQEP